MDALVRVKEVKPRVAIVDLAGGAETLRFLRAVSRQRSTTTAVALTEPHRPEASAEALRLGVIDLVARPLDEAETLAAVANALEFARLAGQTPRVERQAPKGGVLEVSPHMRAVFEMAHRLGPSGCGVLIVGERGTGHETIARLIHANGTAPQDRFIRIVCAEGAKVESALSEVAPPATVFFDDLCELSPDAQITVERWLRGRTPPVTREGERPASAARAIAAALPRIDESLERGLLRRSLFDALVGVRIDLPPLRQRPEDIPLLATEFLKEACRASGLAPKCFSRSALTLLSKLPWRGNATELKQLVNRLALIAPNGMVLQEHVLSEVRLDDVDAKSESPLSLRAACVRFERDFIASVLERHHWRMGPAALELGVERTNLYRKIKQLHISRTNGKTFPNGHHASSV
jgi:DNA-binding NtrC family response regulator